MSVTQKRKTITRAPYSWRHCEDARRTTSTHRNRDEGRAFRSGVAIAPFRRRGVPASRCQPRRQEVEMPEVEGTVEFYQSELGGHFDQNGRVLRFDAVENPLQRENVAWLYDRHHWGRFRVAGEGALEFLHSKTTQSFLQRNLGQGCDALFCNAKGRIEDYATAYVQRDAVLVVLSPDVQERLLVELEKFIFPGDRVELTDLRSQTRMLSLIGSKARDLLSLLNVDLSILDGNYADHQVRSFKGGPVIVAKGCEVDRVHGYTLIVEESASGDLYKNLVDAGAVPIGEEAWEVLRVTKGRPSWTQELPKALNPFELDLFHAVSLNKGCFLGQESIARVYTRNAIRKRLWGIELPLEANQIASGDAIASDGRDVGFISTPPVNHPSKQTRLALAFLNSKVQKQDVHWEGKAVQVGCSSTGTVTALPYMTFDFPDGLGAPSTSATPKEGSEQKEQDKEERLRVMQERLNAFMAQQEQGGP